MCNGTQAICRKRNIANISRTFYIKQCSSFSSDIIMEKIMCKLLVFIILVKIVLSFTGKSVKSAYDGPIEGNEQFIRITPRLIKLGIHSQDEFQSIVQSSCAIE